MEMAAEAAVSFAVETLGKLLIEKAQFLIGVEEDVKWLQKELKSIQCFMKDAAKKQSDDESVRNWISDIGEVAHDAEDAIEIFVLKVQSKSRKKRYGCFPNHLYHLNKVGEQIKSIRQTLIDIQDRCVRYNFKKDGSGDQKAESSSRKRSQGEEIEARRRVAHWKPDQQVVGLEEDVKLLLREAVLKEISEGLLVAAIVGMGGMGKSTLASKIFNHPAVAGGFEFCAWVVVSSEFIPEDIMKQILLKLGISDDELKRIMSIADSLGRQEELKKEVHKRLSGKRYFIVLDDVWEAAHWESLSTAFPNGDKGSRLLLTSRNQVIRTHNGYVHDMKPLGDTESWDLFMKKVFGDNGSINGCPDDLKKVGKEILKRCGGLPLAISVVGGILAEKTRSKSEWEKVYKEMKSHLKRNKDLNNISGILELSYQNLPSVLKACFLCLGFFKEDAILNVKKLVRIWVAQGLVAQEVEGEDGVMMEEVARDNLNELISRNMVQVKEMKHEKVKACQMHDLLRDLSIRKSKEEIDFEVLREERDSQKHTLNKPRHRVIYCTEISSVYSTNRNQHLRSLFVHQENEFPSTSGGPSSYWKSFELLKVLDLGIALFKVFPKAIGELTGLKYLEMIYRGKRSRLPRSWAKLINLEVLCIWCPFDFFIAIDKVILKMERLRHLYAPVYFSKVALRNMRKVQTLHRLLVKSISDVEKMQGMSSLSKLCIDMDDAKYETSALFTCLDSLEKLFHLTLCNLWRSTVVLEGLNSLHRVTQLKLCEVSRRMPISFPPNLSHLTLIKLLLEEDPMPVLEKLPNLLYLKIYKMRSHDGTTMVITNGGFPKLKFLRLHNIEKAYKIEIKESAMPELNQFIIGNCPNLDVENMPERIKSLSLID